MAALIYAHRGLQRPESVRAHAGTMSLWLRGMTPVQSLSLASTGWICAVSRPPFHPNCHGCVIKLHYSRLLSPYYSPLPGAWQQLDLALPMLLAFPTLGRRTDGSSPRC